MFSKTYCLLKERTTLVVVELEYNNFFLKKKYYIHNIDTIKIPFFIYFFLSERKKKNHLQI